MNTFAKSIICLLILIVGCRKTDFDNIEIAGYTSEYAFPLFSTTLSMEDLMFKVLNDSLSSDTLVVNPDKTMTLYYTGDVAQKQASEIFNLIPAGGLPVEDTLYYAPVDNIPNNLTIRQADLINTTVGVTIVNLLPHKVTGTFYIPQMTKNGQAMTMPFSVEAGAPFASFISPRYDATGYSLKSSNNTIFFRYEAYAPDGRRVKFPSLPITNPPTAGLIMTFDTMKFSYLEGYWGYSNNPLTQDTIEIDINQTNLQGGVKIKNPKVTMTISNSWGFPTRGLVKKLSFIGKDGSEYPLRSTVFNNDSIDFNYPKYELGEVGQTKLTSIRLDETNSNIAEIFNAQPTKLIYDVSGIANAKGDSTIIGFLTDSSVIKLSVNVELLLEGSAQNFGADQTLDLNFGDYADLDTAKIEAVEFKLVTENKSPVATALQIYFQNEEDRAIDSLFTGNARFIMEASPVNSNGVANSVMRTENFIPMTAARFDRVRRAKKAFMRTFFTTAQGGQVPVKFLSTDETTIKMGVRVKVKN
jgi:hypothetical protein